MDSQNYHLRREKRRERRAGNADVEMRGDPSAILTRVEKEVGKAFEEEQLAFLDAVVKGEADDVLFRIAKKLQWLAMVDAGDGDRTRMLDSLFRMFHVEQKAKALDQESEVQKDIERLNAALAATNAIEAKEKDASHRDG